MSIHIFNPETDYALASFSPHYTPPAEVLELRRRMALLPLRWAAPGDAVLLLDTPENPLEGASPSTSASPSECASPVAVITLSELPSYLEAHPDEKFSPWGWNPMLCRILAEAGVPAEKLPTEGYLKMLRGLSHRRTSIEFNNMLNSRLPVFCRNDRHCSPLPQEFFSPEEALEWESLNHPAFFKAPWSSSGRGILFTDELDPCRHIEPWLHGIINRQGSVLAEEAAPKVLDFATEWYVEPPALVRPKVHFLGLSVFDASRRGKYHGNMKATQRVLLKRVCEAAPDFCRGIIEAQRSVLESLLYNTNSDLVTVAPREWLCYSGYIGIDMIACADGSIRCGVELNFRRTMGVPMPQVCVIGTGNVGTHLTRAFKEAGMRVVAVSGHCEEIPPAECYIIAVKDDKVAEVASRIDPPEGCVIAHTSGSVPLETVTESVRPLPDGSRPCCGVFYPLQTFTKSVPMDYHSLPLLIEGADSTSEELLLELARNISANVSVADSATRGKYHLAAALTCNFFNHLCTLADEYLTAQQLDFRMLLPLLRQTVEKLSHASPAESQTGPAVRGDMKVIEEHLRKLQDFPATAQLYRALSDSIIGMYGAGTGATAKENGGTGATAECDCGTGATAKEESGESEKVD